MSGAVISSNVSLKVNRAISGATTVNSNCYAVVDYLMTGLVGNASISGTNPLAAQSVVTRNFGPAQTIPNTFTQDIYFINGATVNTCVATYTLTRGYELINSP